MKKMTKAEENALFGPEDHEAPIVSKQTPGRWDVSFGELNGIGEFSVYQGESGTICRGDNEMVAWKANARLIAAAPELLEALKRLLGAIEADAKISPNMPIRISFETNGQAIEQARAAIAKAEEAK